MPSWVTPLTWTFKLIPTFTTYNLEIRDKLLFFKTLFDDSANLAPPARTTLTLATDACTPTQNAHAVDTEAAAASDNLSTLTIAGSIRSGALLILSAANVAHVVTVKDSVGNIALLGGDCVLNSVKSFLLLQLVGTTWFELSRSLIAPTSPSLVTATGVVSITISGLDLATDQGYDFDIETTDAAGATTNSLTAQINAASVSGDGWAANYNRAASPGLTAAGGTGAALWEISAAQVSAKWSGRLSLRLVGAGPHPYATWHLAGLDSSGGAQNVIDIGGSGMRQSATNVTSIKFALSGSTCDWRVIVRKIRAT